MDLKQHWNNRYGSCLPNQITWHQATPQISLDLIKSAVAGKGARIIDVGGGSSHLVDHLLEVGYSQVTVLDLSDEALKISQDRLADRQDRVEWLCENIFDFHPDNRFDLWHDRACFHFLTADCDRNKYKAAIKRSLNPGGSVILSTFAADGPTICSNLEVIRYDQNTMCAELGSEFKLEETLFESHITPKGTQQQFVYFRFKWRK